MVPALQRLAHTLRALSLGSVGLSFGLWLRAKTVTQDERGNAERRALFVGLWPFQLWLMGETVERWSRRGRRAGSRSLRRRGFAA